MKKIYRYLIFTIILIFYNSNIYAYDQFLFKNINSKLQNVSLNDQYFNLQDYGLLTPVKNQMNTNSCWTFATTSSIESNLIINNYGINDLSEAHIELSTQNTYPYNHSTFKREINTGGNYNMVASYIMNGWGPILENDLPLQRLQDLLNNRETIEDDIINVKPIVNVDSIAYIRNEGICKEDTIKDIKEYLVSNGALAATVYADNVNVFKKYNYYDGKTIKKIDGTIIPENAKVNHGVTIIGWDDTIAKENFSKTNPPTRDGAFIIKNSYGEKINMGNINAFKYQIYNKYKNIFNIQNIDELTTDKLTLLISKIYEIDTSDISYQNNDVYINVGDNGYEYISYDDIYICNEVVGFFNTSKNVLDYNYYYDDLGYNAIYQTYNVNQMYLSSIFTKQSLDNEKIEKISMYFPKMNERYEVYYKEGDNNILEDATKIGEGKVEFIGYDTMDLDIKPIITSDKYTIFVKLIDDDKEVQLGVSTKSKGTYENMNLISDVQFISKDGKTFTDVTKQDTKFHLTLKVSTNKTIAENIELDVTKPTENPNNLNINNRNTKKILQLILIIDFIVIIIDCFLIIRNKRKTIK